MKNLLIIINTIFGLFAILWLNYAVHSGFEDIGLTVLLGIYPLIYISSLLWSIKIFKSGRKARAVLVSLIPLIPIILGIITIFVILFSILMP